MFIFGGPILSAIYTFSFLATYEIIIMALSLVLIDFLLLIELWRRWWRHNRPSSSLLLTYVLFYLQSVFVMHGYDYWVAFTNYYHPISRSQGRHIDHDFFIKQAPVAFVCSNIWRLATCHCSSAFSIWKPGGYISILHIILPFLYPNSFCSPESHIDCMIICSYVIGTFSCNWVTDKRQYALLFLFTHLFPLLVGMIDPRYWYTMHIISLHGGFVYCTIESKQFTTQSE